MITGNSSGIGLATKEQIIADGGRVLVSGTNAERLAAARGERIETIVNDAKDPAAAAALAEEAKRLFGKIDGAFLNAGTGAGMPLAQMTVEPSRSVVDLNIGGVLFGAQTMVLILRPGGSFLVTASAAKNR